MNETLKTQLVKQNKLKRVNEQNIKTLKDFIELFVNLNNREPMESEIYDNLKDKIDIATIKKLLEENKILAIKTDKELDFEDEMV
jgi:uncharacterized membrane protein